MKIGRILVGLIAVVIVALGLLQVTDNQYLVTALQRTYLAGNETANINDHEVFATRVIKGGNVQPWPQAAGGLRPLPEELLTFLSDNDAIAFLALHRGEVVAEQYLQGYTAESRTNSFSMAKTVLTLLLGIAIEEGRVEGLEQPLLDWLPEFSEDPNARLASLGSLSAMTSGYEWDERYYSALSPTVKLVYGDDVTDFVLDGEFSKTPESYFYYSSASTQLLATTLARALQQSDPEATLSGYLSEKLWQPLGMDADGLWHLDNSGMELAFCCINTSARNFARFGQLMLQDGVWEGQQLVPTAFVEAMRSVRGAPDYGLSTWLNTENEPAFYSLRGHLGQYVVVVPEYDLVIVRLGESRAVERETMEEVLPFYIEQVLSVLH
ncbi:class C beta-lactamase-related serine hydrolase [Halieaceae bacterium IMCC14734]|uniref:Class C beta-lactamase-related serine hydrolase n=1 Tax=Candidatus Litorirhabdus singularis TaxID=2518993 RepID=A0ABT3TBN2_9GAMM|nr:serine hydrolase [Candidatus Litorirhabdus singularis]MCX2979703.1 class C beta-lactamase-related serine hydrolase [Candidatus Litorirhabdus singularis]